VDPAALRALSSSPTLIFDFDSTLVSVEGLDFLFARGLAGRAGHHDLLRTFHALTDAGMAGDQPQEATLRARLALFPHGGPDPELIRTVAAEITERLAASVVRQREFFRREAWRIHIVSGGFRELIDPTARWLGLPQSQVTAHAFQNTPAGLRLDPTTPMATGGKVGAIRQLLGQGLVRSDAPLWIIGDGATDLEVRSSGIAEHFIAYTEHVVRPPVVTQADAVADCMEALLAMLPPSISAPLEP
jgi:D-3-phosphoglycerate dehydrogenase / 2-oxoglutarate reductase